MKRFLTLAVAALLYTGGLAQSFSFTPAPGSPITVTVNMRCLLTNDLNNDGKKDLMIGNAYGSKIYMFHGNGSGQFSTAPGSPMGNLSGAISMAVADYNGDNKLDIAALNYYNSNVFIYINTGPGTYTQVATPFTTAYMPYCIDTADFNLDGKKDLVTCSAISGSVIVSLGTGLGTFNLAPSFPIPAVAPYHVCTGRFNNDNFPDFAFVNGNGNSMQMFLGNGAGGFTAAPGSPYTTGTQPRTICVKDLNNDGFSDFVIPNAMSNNLTILMGSASGSCTPAPGSPVATGNYPYQAVVADFDLNGTQDIIATNTSSNNIYMLSGLGNGSFVATTSPSYSVGTGPQSICTADFNGDGKNDLAVSDFAGNKINILLNTTPVCLLSGAFTNTVSANGQVNFASNTTGTSVASTFSWNFGDGSSGTGSQVSYVYSPGSYTVTLTINDGPCTATATSVIVVVAGPTGLHEYNTAADFNIYPNPAAGKINITVQNARLQGDMRLVVYTLLGQEALNTELLLPTNQLDLSGFKNGVFLYRIIQKNRTLKTGSIMLQD